jgi:FkbM family methyltransferase
MTAFRDFFRRRRVRRHVARNGLVFDFHGQKVTLPALDNPGFASALLRGKYEAEEAELIRLYLPPTLPVIELGGSFGIVSRLIASKLARGTPHIVVEANPQLIGICTLNAAGGPAATEIVEAAIAYGGPQAAFHVTGDVHSNRLAGDGDAGASVTVPAISLAQLVTRIGTPETFTLISDIEGGELEMIRREPDVLAQAGTVIMELHPKLYPAGAADEAALLADMHRLGFTQRERFGDVCVWTKG